MEDELLTKYGVFITIPKILNLPDIGVAIFLTIRSGNLYFIFVSIKWNII